MEIQNKVALITGTRRIGAVVGLWLAEKGADVVLTYNRSKDEAEEAVRAVQAKQRKARALQADLGRNSDVDALVKRVVQEFGRIDILVNMASVYRSKAFLETTEADWDLNINANLKSAYLCAKAVVPAMRAQGGGRIINFSDWIAASGPGTIRNILRSRRVSKNRRGAFDRIDR